LEKNEDNLKSEKLYLYFLQLGRDIYTGEQININELLTNSNNYNRDHIIPRSMIPDDSIINNKVLTRVIENENKLATYPVDDHIQNKMGNFWKYLKQCGLMTPTKYDKLISKNKLTDDQINAFVSKQKTATDWANREAAILLMKYFNKSDKENFIVYSKAKNVSAFRNKYEILKNRNLNNRHHAEDAYLNTLIGLLSNSKLLYTTDKSYNPKSSRNIEKIIEHFWDNSKISLIKREIGIKDQLITKRLDLKTSGQYWNESVISPKDGKKEEKLKQPIKYNNSKLGFMNKIKTAFFSVIKFTYNDKEITKIVPIMTYECGNFLRNGRINQELLINYIPKCRYLEENNRDKKKEIKIINIPWPLLPINAFVIYDNKYHFRIAGRSGDKILVHNRRELQIDFNLKQQLVLKTILSDKKKEDCRSIIERLVLKDHNFINSTDKSSEHTTEKNGKMISFLVDILNKVCEKRNDYLNFVSSKLDEEFVTKFSFSDVDTQINIIREVFSKLLAANQSNQCFLKLNNDKGVSVGSQSFSCNLDKKLVYIKESVTGYYKREIELN
jgi:CRISPR-associated endonuclease Csn1